NQRAEDLMMGAAPSEVSPEPAPGAVYPGGEARLTRKCAFPPNREKYRENPRKAPDWRFFCLPETARKSNEFRQKLPCRREQGIFQRKPGREQGSGVRVNREFPRPPRAAIAV